MKKQMITANNDTIIDLLHYLRTGSENAIKKDNLAQLCNTNERALRIALRELLETGVPVCGSPRPPYGYFIADCPGEIKGEMALIKSYGKELWYRYKALRKCLRKMESQLPTLDNGQGRLL